MVEIFSGSDLDSIPGPVSPDPDCHPAPGRLVNAGPGPACKRTSCYGQKISTLEIRMKTNLLGFASGLLAAALAAQDPGLPKAAAAKPAGSNSA